MEQGREFADPFWCAVATPLATLLRKPLALKEKSFWHDGCTLGHQRRELTAFHALPLIKGQTSSCSKEPGL
jgi:hypothetical protein